MHIAGRRIHIAGSANAKADVSLLAYGHTLIDQFVRTLTPLGATFVVGVGKEPRARPSDPFSLPLIFDWTVLAAADASLQVGSARAMGAQGQLIATIATTKTVGQIPEDRRGVWGHLQAAGAIEMQFVEPGWTSGAIRRARQARFGDMLVGLSGGEGVEHLAQLYAEAGKPVLMFDLELGSISGDGSGGAARLAQRALAHPEEFVRLHYARRAGTLLSNIATHEGKRPVSEVVEGMMALIEALVPPRAFYVRLLDPKAREYNSVDRFFERVVDPVACGFGYEPIVMGRGKNEYAWMNEAIFDSLHRSAMVITDITALRPNCFMELGYALGGGQRVLVTAKTGTRVPFDAQMFEYHPWRPRASIEQEQERLRAYWQRNANRPPIVTPRSTL